MAEVFGHLAPIIAARREQPTDLVARAEMLTAIGAVLDGLPGLRLDADAEEPRIIGMYERGPTVVPVVWDRAG